MIKNILITVGLVAAMSFAAFAKTDVKYQTISMQLVSDANIALQAKKLTDAQLLFERAMVADPANTQALLGLGKAHEAQGHIGKGLKYYRLALEIEPNDKTLLTMQSLAFLKQEMFDRADANRGKLARLCPNGCAALSSVDTAIKAYLADEKTGDVAQAKPE